jgi:hypothetical protein
MKNGAQVYRNVFALTPYPLNYLAPDEMIIGVVQSALNSGIRTNQLRYLMFGDNSYSQIGLGAISPILFAPSEVVIPNKRIAYVSRDVGLGSNPATLVITDGCTYSGPAISFVTLPCKPGQLYAAGCGSMYGMGDGTTADRAYFSGPIALPAGTGYTVEIANAGNDYLVLQSTGKLYAWGKNSYGHLGDGTLTASGTPKAVDVSTNSALYQKSVVMIRCAQYHCMALTSENTLVGWGYDNSGALSYGSTAVNRNYPIASLKGSISSALIADVQALSLFSMVLTGKYL